MDNPVYQCWKIFVVLTCIVSSYIYASVAAFKIPDSDSPIHYVNLSFEVIFMIDMCVQFVLEYKPEDQFNKVRDIAKISKRYIKTRFLFDSLAIVPFHIFFSE